MSEPTPLEDNLLLRVWEVGSPARTTSIRGFQPTVEGRNLQKLVEMGWIKFTIRSDLECPRCNHRYELVDLDRVLVCAKCGTQVDTRTEFQSERYTYEPSFEYLEEAVVSTLLKGKIARKGAQKPLPSIEGVRHLGTFVTPAETEIDAFLTRSALKPRQLRELWGTSLQEGLSALVVSPSISDQAERILRLAVASIPALCVRADSLTSGETLSQVCAFPTFREDLSARVSAFSQVLGAGTGSATPLSPIVPEDIEELARTGGRRFEAPALRLMMPIGVTEHINAPGYLPDGLLMLPDGFWIVDTKSAEVSFSFDVRERDKAFRYLSTIQDGYRTPLKGWTFYGEIILTRTDPIEERRLRAARDYFVAQKIESTVVVLSFEGMKGLFERAWEDPGYWHRYDVGKDPLRLLLLSESAVKWAGVGPVEREFSTGPLRFVSRPVVESYWDYVKERDEYPYMGDRTPGYVSTKLQRLFGEKFSRP